MSGLGLIPRAALRGSGPAQGESGFSPVSVTLAFAYAFSMSSFIGTRFGPEASACVGSPQCSIASANATRIASTAACALAPSSSAPRPSGVCASRRFIARSAERPWLGGGSSQTSIPSLYVVDIGAGYDVRCAARSSSARTPPLALVAATIASAMGPE